jgi:hypothetical protein
VDVRNKSERKYCQGNTCIGRILDILATSSSAVIIVSVYQISEERDPMFAMPVLTQPFGEEISVIIPEKARMLHVLEQNNDLLETAGH